MSSFLIAEKEITMELELRNKIAADEEGIRLRREADLLRKIKLLHDADLRHREIIDRRRARA